MKDEALAGERVTLARAEVREMDLQEALQALRKISDEFEAWAETDDVKQDAGGSEWAI